MVRIGRDHKGIIDSFLKIVENISGQAYWMMKACMATAMNPSTNREATM